MLFAVAMLIRLPMTSRLGGDGQRIEITYRERTVAVQVASGASFAEADWLRFTARDFDTRADAEEFGQSFRGHLRLASVTAKFPMDLGDGEFVSRVGESVKATAAADGGQMLDSVHGLVVYEQSDKDWFVFGRANGFSSQLPAKLFDDALSSVEQDLPPVADGTSLALACDLLAVHTFDQSRRAQFVTLVTALEALAAHNHELAGRRPPRGSTRAIEIVDGWLDSLGDETGLDPNELQSLRSRVGELKRRSISESIQSMAREHAPGDAADPNDEFLAKCYELRSRLVHGHAVAPDVAPFRDRLRSIVGELVLALAAVAP